MCRRPPPPHENNMTHITRSHRVMGSSPFLFQPCCPLVLWLHRLKIEEGLKKLSQINPSGETYMHEGMIAVRMLIAFRFVLFQGRISHSVNTPLSGVRADEGADVTVIQHHHRSDWRQAGGLPLWTEHTGGKNAEKDKWWGAVTAASCIDSHEASKRLTLKTLLF